MQLKITDVLLYYDIPQLFVAINGVSGKFLCLAIDNESYLLLPVSVEKLYKITSGKLDLKVAFENSELDSWYLWSLRDSETVEFDSKLIITQIQEEWLPDSDFYLSCDENQEEEQLIKDVLEKQNTLLEISISDKDDGTSISLHALSSFIDGLQWMVSSGYKKMISRVSPYNKEQLKDTYLSTISAYAVSRGSFKLHLEIDSQPTIGPSYIESVLQNIDNLFTDWINENQIIEHFQNNKWHALKSIKKFLDSVRENNLHFKYKWAWLGEKLVSKRNVSSEKVQYLSELLARKEELTIEKKTFIGIVQDADVKWEWRIRNQEDNKEYRWKYDSWFSGWIEVNGKKYEFICEELVESYTVSGSEKVAYQLISYKEIQA